MQFLGRMMMIMLGLLGIHPTLIRLASPELRRVISLLFQMSSLTPGLVFLTIFIALLPLQVSAFGAGDIPDFAFLNGSSYPIHHSSSRK